MSARIDPTRPFIPLRLAVLTISDTRTPKTDKSGPLLVQMIEEAGHTVADRMVAPDDRKSIRKAVKRWVKADGVDVVITTGGTGFTGRDVTPEAVRLLFDKEIDGFSVLFHMLSYQTVGTSTVQSRACGGLAKNTLIFSLLLRRAAAPPHRGQKEEEKEVIRPFGAFAHTALPNLRSR